MSTQDSNILKRFVNHILSITKIARKWEDLTLDEQKGYLSRHPQSKRKITAIPGQLNSIPQSQTEPTYTKQQAIDAAADDLALIWQVLGEPNDTDYQIISQRYGVSVDDIKRKAYDTYEKRRTRLTILNDTLYTANFFDATNTNVRDQLQSKFVDFAKNKIKQKHPLDNIKNLTDAEIEYLYGDEYRIAKQETKNLIDEHFPYLYTEPTKQFKLSRKISRLHTDLVESTGGYFWENPDNNSVMRIIPMSTKEVINLKSPLPAILQSISKEIDVPYDVITKHLQFQTELAYEDRQRSKSLKKLIVNTTLERLPRVIKGVVEDIPVTFREQKPHGSNTAAYYKQGKITFYKDQHSTFSRSVHDMAHEYWHAFEHASGFIDKSENQFDYVVNQLKLGNFSTDAMKDFYIIADTVSQFTEDPSFLMNLKSFKLKWLKGDKDYFIKHNKYLGFINQVEKTVKHRDFYESLGEVLAESLANMVTFESKKSLSQSFEHWMHQKFSNKSLNFIK